MYTVYYVCARGNDVCHACVCGDDAKYVVRVCGDGDGDAGCVCVRESVYECVDYLSTGFLMLEINTVDNIWTNLLSRQVSA